VQLKKENALLKQENGDLKKKRKSEDAASSGPPTKKAKTPAQRKKLFEKWSKALKRESAKTKITNGSWGGESFSVDVKETTPWSPADFGSFFQGHGTKIQPTPDNKPTSQITILEFSTFDQVKALFDDTIEQGGYTAASWRRRNFSKSFKSGELNAELESCQVHFNKSKLTLHLKFEMRTKQNDDFY
jgi:hypothetical protein